MVPALGIMGRGGVEGEYGLQLFSSTIAWTGNTRILSIYALAQSNIFFLKHARLSTRDCTGDRVKCFFGIISVFLSIVLVKMQICISLSDNILLMKCLNSYLLVPKCNAPRVISVLPPTRQSLYLFTISLINTLHEYNRSI